MLDPAAPSGERVPIFPDSIGAEVLGSGFCGVRDLQSDVGSALAEEGSDLEQPAPVMDLCELDSCGVCAGLFPYVVGWVCARIICDV